MQNAECGIKKTNPKSEIRNPNSEGGYLITVRSYTMFFNRELNAISGKKSISQKDLNAAVDAVGLPYGFQYSKRFLLFGIRWVYKVEKVGESTYRVPSESKPGKLYNVTLDPLSCECPAFHRFKVTPYPFCKHIVAAMVKEQDITDAFFDWLILKGKNGVGSMDNYIQARWEAGTASTSILEQCHCEERSDEATKPPIIPSFSWKVAYQKCCEVVGMKAIVDIIINDLVNWGFLRQASPSEYNRAEWIIIYDWCKKEAKTPRDQKSLNQWSYNSAVVIERCLKAIADVREKKNIEASL
jgi:hypothetical protein